MLASFRLRNPTAGVDDPTVLSDLTATKRGAGFLLFNSNARSLFVGPEPNSSLGFHLGSFARINDTFDLYWALAWSNRDDAIVPHSEFGTQAGGFDQFTITIGAVFGSIQALRRAGGFCKND